MHSNGVYQIADKVNTTKNLGIIYLKAYGLGE